MIIQKSPSQIHEPLVIMLDLVNRQPRLSFDVVQKFVCDYIYKDVTLCIWNVKAI